MRKIIQENFSFFAAYTAFLLLGIVVLSATEQGDIIRFFSDNRSNAGIIFFRFFTNMGEEIIYLILIFLLLFVRFRYSLFVFLNGVLVVIFTIGTKILFGHDRPAVYFYKTMEFDSLNLVEGVELFTGSYSFPSGHTISAFALYGLIAFGIHYRKKLTGIIFLLTAVLIAISRIYLVQHFLKDVFAGSIVGIFIALSVYYLHLQIPENGNNVIDQSLITLFRKRKKTKAN